MTKAHFVRWSERGRRRTQQASSAAESTQAETSAKRVTSTKPKPSRRAPRNARPR